MKQVSIAVGQHPIAAIKYTAAFDGFKVAHTLQSQLLDGISNDLFRILHPHHRQKTGIDIENHPFLDLNNRLLCDVGQLPVVGFSVLQGLLAETLFADVRQLQDVQAFFWTQGHADFHGKAHAPGSFRLQFHAKGCAVFPRNFAPAEVEIGAVLFSPVQPTAFIEAHTTRWQSRFPAKQEARSRIGPQHLFSPNQEERRRNGIHPRFGPIDPSIIPSVHAHRSVFAPLTLAMRPALYWRIKRTTPFSSKYRHIPSRNPPL